MLPLYLMLLCWTTGNSHIIKEIMIIQCGCSDMMLAEDRKLHSHLEWPKKNKTEEILE